jgi:hypothetical protein
MEDLAASDEGWLCPAFDCRYDILWDLAQALDLDFQSLVDHRCVTLAIASPHRTRHRRVERCIDLATVNGWPCRWEDILPDEAFREAVAASKGTILDMDLPSDDESDDNDFREDASDGEDRRGVHFISYCHGQMVTVRCAPSAKGRASMQNIPIVHLLSERCFVVAVLQEGNFKRMKSVARCHIFGSLR